MVNLLKKGREYIEECCHANVDPAQISELLSPSCLSRFVVGRRSGKSSYLNHAKDWFTTFPDFNTKLIHIEQQGQIVIADTKCTGTFLNPYKMSEQEEHLNNFCKTFSNMKPTKARFSQYSTFFLFFEGTRLSKVLVEEDPLPFFQQLGVNILPSENPQKDLKELCKTLNSLLHATLAPREIEVITLSFCGFSAKYIAELLHISYRTVEAHLLHTYQKLGCLGKQQLLELMHTKSLLPLCWEIGQLVFEQITKK